MKQVDINCLIGKTIHSIVIAEDKETILIDTSIGESYKMYHSQNCCEQVSVEDICGDLNDVLGNPILVAEETISNNNPDGIQPEYQDSFTWTFYKLSTIKGSVTIRWYGSSNGYYSERVDFVKI